VSVPFVDFFGLLTDARSSTTPRSAVQEDGASTAMCPAVREHVRIVATNGEEALDHPLLPKSISPSGRSTTAREYLRGVSSSEPDGANDFVIVDGARDGSLPGLCDRRPCDRRG
jgi:hypothetical protein